MTKRFLSPLSTNHVDFNQTHPSTTAVGRVLWDDGEGTLSVGLKGGHVNLQIGQENVVLAYNGTGSTIADGSVVYISGAQGQRPSVTLAQANAEATSSKVLGIATEPIANGAEGFVTTFGVVNGVNTSTFTAGDALWLSPTVAGGLTATKPVAPNHMVFVGYALHINASSGRIFVNPQNGYELDELHDVLMGTKTDRDVLMYESSTGLWKNEQINLGTDTVGNYVASISTSDGISGGAAGSEGAAISLTNTDKGSSQNIFKNVAVSGQTTVVADSNNDTLTFANGTGITITTNATTDTVTVTNSGVTALTGTANEIDVSASTGSVTLSLPATINADTTGNAATVTNGVYTTGSYADPSWITSLAWSKISGEPTTLSGYGITDALSNSTTSTQNGYFGNIYLYDDSTPSHYLAITNSANLTLARTLSINVNDADRTVSLSGNLTVSSAATVSGTNTGDQTITLTGDVTGSGTGSFATTLANSGVTAGTYNNVATEVRPFTVDVKGRVTGIGTAVTITPAWSSITSKPTTLSGYGITDALNTSATEQTKSGNLNIGGNLAVTGNLTINGTTTTVNSTTVTVDDPIITLGGDTAPVADDNKDRGIEFRYYDTQARLGFMGYDDSAGTFVFLTAATNTSEVFTGTKGTIDANISGSNINAGTVSATYIDSAIARLASPTFTGTPAAPTAAVNTNTTQIATTAFVVGQAGTANPLVNGTVAVGTSLLYSRQDHVHPTDTSRAADNAVVHLAGTETITGAKTFSANLTMSASDILMGNTLGDRVTLYGTHDAAVAYAIGIESNTMYFKSGNSFFRWYVAANADGGTSDVMELASTGLTINGALLATTKSFDIEHPTKENMRLRYGSLEGPENGVYVRGKTRSSIITLPDYWTGLVDEDSITVQLTPYGKRQRLYVKNICDNTVEIGGVKGEFYYFIQAERKDVDKLVVEYGDSL